MASETCKICRYLSTPWTYITALKGHICCNCSYLVPVFERQFEMYITRIRLLESDVDGENLEYLTLKQINKFTKAVMKIREAETDNVTIK